MIPAEIALAGLVLAHGVGLIIGAAMGRVIERRRIARWGWNQRKGRSFLMILMDIESGAHWR